MHEVSHNACGNFLHTTRMPCLQNGLKWETFGKFLCNLSLPLFVFPGMLFMAISWRPDIHFKANHGFFFALKDQSSNFFAGRVVKP